MARAVFGEATESQSVAQGSLFSACVPRASALRSPWRWRRSHSGPAIPFHRTAPLHCRAAAAAPWRHGAAPDLVATKVPRWTRGSSPARRKNGVPLPLLPSDALAPRPAPADHDGYARAPHNICLFWAYLSNWQMIPPWMRHSPLVASILRGSLLPLQSAVPVTQRHGPWSTHLSQLACKITSASAGISQGQWIATFPFC